MPDSEPILDATHAKFLQRGISMGVAACDRDSVPTLTRATGCRISEDRRRVTVFVSSTQAAPVLQCLNANGAIAVVFSEPSTHRTVQLKGKEAQIGTLVSGDLQLITDYRDAFVRELAPLGFDETQVRSLFAYPSAEIVSLCFTPVEAFSQTPGPHAGAPLRSRP